MASDPTCKWTFQKASVCQTHWLQVHGPKNHACQEPDCKTAFETAKLLGKYMKGVHGPKNFACLYPGCLSAFTMIHGFNLHMKSHKDGQPARNWQFVCPVDDDDDKPETIYEVCDMCFSTEKTLQTHQLKSGKHKRLMALQDVRVGVCVFAE
ncbi:hypothetical protein HDU98_006106 [Podochytrium sp. JEL0797]|nr:hypothetical protein HDU98_006106 [Podochytrium sp. JEL0797]